MRLRSRFLLVGFGVLVFVIATPILVLFTRGFEIDWTNHKFVKTGAFVIKTLPNKADVYINDKLAKGATPETIRFLLPGDYGVRIEKDGYQSWTKRLTINPQFATWINQDRDFITLFYEQAQQLSRTAVNFAQSSTDGSQIGYVSSGDLFIYNPNNQTSEKLGDISDFHAPFTFTPTLAWSDGFKVWSYFTNHTTALPLDASSISRVQANGGYITFLIKDQLYTISNNTPLLLDKGVSGMFLDGENVWYTGNHQLKVYNLRTNISNIAFPSIPTNSTSQIIRGEGTTFLILDSSLYVVNDTLEKIFDGVNTASYDNDSHTLLFANSNEIYTYNPSLKKTDLILRSISQISHSLLNSYTGYVFFVNEGKIKAIELDGRDHRNIYTIIDNIPTDSNFTVSQDGSLITVYDNSVMTTYRIR